MRADIVRDAIRERVQDALACYYDDPHEGTLYALENILQHLYLLSLDLDQLDLYQEIGGQLSGVTMLIESPESLGRVH